MRYGIPFMGSKNKLADQIIDLIPPTNTFIDLFAGGCAMSHAALLSNKFNHVISNDITDAPILFKQALEGNVPNLYDWVSKQEFHALKNQDARIRILWSYANNQTDYIYGNEAENYKMHVHQVIFNPDPMTRYKEFREATRLAQDFKNNQGDPQNLEILQHIQYFQNIEEIKNPSLTKNLQTSQLDYQKFPFSNFDPSSTIIYMDPPYDKSHGYNYEFSTLDFIQSVNRLAKLNFPILISERTLPFQILKEFTIPNVSNPKGRNPVPERLYSFNFKPTNLQRKLF